MLMILQLLPTHLSMLKMKNDMDVSDVSEILRPPPPLIVVADPSSVVTVSVVSVMLLSSMVVAVDVLRRRFTG